MITWQKALEQHMHSRLLVSSAATDESSRSSRWDGPCVKHETAVSVGAVPVFGPLMSVRNTPIFLQIRCDFVQEVAFLFGPSSSEFGSPPRLILVGTQHSPDFSSETRISRGLSKLCLQQKVLSCGEKYGKEKTKIFLNQSKKQKFTVFAHDNEQYIRCRISGDNCQTWSTKKSMFVLP